MTKSFVQGCDIFVRMPTGSKKILFSMILPDILNFLSKVKSSIVVIVSPLITLMKADQV